MALIGLLSDSHGRAGITRRAVQLLLDRGAKLLLHLGDIGTSEVLDALAPGMPRSQTGAGAGPGPIESHLVFGNADVDARGLATHARMLGLRVDHPAGRLDLAGRALVFTHGDNPALLARALAEGVAYLCHGHSHHREDQRRGPTRIINPGALCRAAGYSVALLDTDHDRVDFIPVADD